MALGLAGLFLLTDKPIAMPHGSHLERFATMLVFILTIGRCMFLGIFSSSLKHSLYQSGLKLKEAYKRIEELAELDELTGSFNRRCIMRMLDEEIARAARSGSPCSIALIDLDHFKRVNDTYGHPTGDEVLRTFAITMFANHPQRRPLRPLWRRGIPAGAARHGDRRRRACDRPAARHRRRARLERVLAGHEGDAVRRRRHADAGRDDRHFPRARRQRALCSQGAGTQPHRPRLIDETITPATENPPPAQCSRTEVMSSKPAKAPDNLLDELQATLAHGTVARRVEALRRVTDLFLNGAVDYSDEQIDLFDDVFQCLMQHIETSAKALLANRLAPVDTAPPMTIRALAFDDVIEVAGPVLTQSNRLDDETLIETARSKSQAHLLAISNRKTLSGAVTDVLVLRGNDEVVQNTVNNPGAEFTERGFTRLVNRAEGDDDLATCVGLRPTIPRHLYLKLLAKASDAVRQRLEAAHPAQARRGADRGQGGDPPRAFGQIGRRPSRPRSRMRWSSRCSTTGGSTNSRSPPLPKPASSTKPTPRSRRSPTCR